MAVAVYGLLLSQIVFAAAQDNTPASDPPPIKAAPLKIDPAPKFSKEYQKIEQDADLWNFNILENSYGNGRKNFVGMIQKYTQLINKVDGELDVEADKYRKAQSKLKEVKEDVKAKIEERKRQLALAKQRADAREANEKKIAAEKAVKEQEAAAERAQKEREKQIEMATKSSDKAKALIAEKAKLEISSKKKQLEEMKRKMLDDEQKRNAVNETENAALEERRIAHQDRIRSENSRLQKHEQINQRLTDFLQRGTFKDFKEVKIFEDEGLSDTWTQTDINDVAAMKSGADKNFDDLMKVEKLKKKNDELESLLKSSKRLMKELVQASTSDAHASPLV